jgi:aromatic-L-amino-acid/L-tryptophan decarboxylase
VTGKPPSGYSPTALEPDDQDAFRALAHRLLDDMLDDLALRRDRPLWKPIPDAVRALYHEASPRAATPLDALRTRFLTTVLPYATGNTHPGFMGWVHGGGTAIGMVAEMLAAGLNANLGGRDHMPVEVERQVLRWVREWFGMPADAGGVLVTGTSMANVIAVLVARQKALGPAVRRDGVAAAGKRLTAYAGDSAHACVAQAMEVAGLGSAALRRIPLDDAFRVDLRALARTIAADRVAGCAPFLIVGTAGTVDVGAIDDLHALADRAAKEGAWFHVDGAFGALAILSPAIAPRLAGIERADSIAFDFHKWGQVPYDAGCVLVRDGRLHQKTFATPAAYLRREARGLAGGAPWFCDFGPELSRGFRALKVWFTIKHFGTDRLGAVIAECCRLAVALGDRIDAEPDLERLAPIALNVVCFRHRAGDVVTREIAVALQEAGEVAPSTTTIDGRLALRAAIVNHRTAERDIAALVDQAVAAGRRLSGATGGSKPRGTAGT